jgi:molybdopterin-guanine dinucleotide biosynthesis protein
MLRFALDTVDLPGNLEEAIFRTTSYHDIQLVEGFADSSHVPKHVTLPAPSQETSWLLALTTSIANNTRCLRGRVGHLFAFP